MAKEEAASIDFLLPTVEAVVLSGISGLVGQAFAAYRQHNLYSFDVVQVLQFIIFSAITTPPNYAFQYLLELAFPSKTVDEKSKQERLSVRNTVIKFFLDQSIAATVNTALYICLMGGIKGHAYTFIQDDLFTNFFSLLFASYRFWPFVCLLNFSMVPMKYRPLVGTLAGLVWGVYLTLRG